MQYLNKFWLTALTTLALYGWSPGAQAQSPAGIAGTAWGMAVADGIAPLASTGYYFIIAGNSGNAYQIFNITGTTASGGSYNYVSNGASATLNFADSVFGNLNTSLAFSDVNYGNYTTTNPANGGEQDGNFIIFGGSAPASIAGNTFLYTINDGANPFAASGTATVKFATAGNTYTILGDGVNVPNSSGTYIYARLTTAAGRITFNDSLSGLGTEMIAFNDLQTGSFGTRNNQSSGYQVGDFQIFDSTVPTIKVIYPVNGSNLSNEVITVNGTAADNFGVSDVLYSVNGSLWVEANTGNNWTNWTASVALNPGQNTIQSYSVDLSGNCSITNTTSFYYVVCDTLHLQINGGGRITPNYNNTLLPDGKTYSIKAVAAPGFAFANWTDESNNIITNSATLTFTTTAGLSYTANFADITPPIVNITVPAPGQRFSNNTITVSGHAKDNASVANVFYSLNNSSWTPTTSSNNWTNWSTAAQLIPGANSLSVCAVDGAGNISATNSVKFNYVLSAPLSVLISGRGNILPACNGMMLPIGQKYTLRAIPSNGFIFSNWSDPYGNQVSSQPVFSFVMASNLAFNLNFRDVAKPTLTIATKPQDLLTSSEFLSVSGAASDNTAVASVFFSLNGGGWTAASTTNNFASWTASLDLIPGTNLFSAYAVDTSGNTSAAKSVKIVYSIAPANLSGYQFRVSPPTTSPYHITFGANSFGRTSTDTNNINGIGTYSYSRLSPTNGILRLGYTGPLLSANNGIQTLSLTFNTGQTGSFFNNSSQITENFTFATTPSLTITSLVKRTIIFIDGHGVGSGMYFYHGVYYVTDLLTGATNLGNTLAYTKYSPVNTLLKQTNELGITYTLAEYFGTNYGIAYKETHAPDGSYLSSDTGFFGFVSQPPDNNAPTSLVGQILTVISSNSCFNLDFADSTFGQQSSTADFDNGVGSYTFNLVDSNTGNLALNYTATPDITGESSSAWLSFFAPNLAYIINPDNSISAAVLATDTNFTASATMPPILLATNGVSGDINQFQFGNDGTYSVTGDWPSNGTYTFTGFSPMTVMVPLTPTTGSYAGDSGWLQLNYSSWSGGIYKVSFFDEANDLLYSEQGMFGQP